VIIDRMVGVPSLLPHCKSIANVRGEICLRCQRSSMTFLCTVKRSGHRVLRLFRSVVDARGQPQCRSRRLVRSSSTSGKEAKPIKRGMNRGPQDLNAHEKVNDLGILKRIVLQILLWLGETRATLSSLCWR
jgi:hypothetical protein